MSCLSCEKSDELLATTRLNPSSRAKNFLFNSLVRMDKCNVYFYYPDHKTTCPKKPATAIQGVKKSLFISTMSQFSEKLNSR